jgi:mannosyl-oligosaccharide alpha-1,2-mannosidase
VTDIDNGKPSHVFEHLSCFLPGLFALAAHTLSLPARDLELHQWAAKGLANTCWTTYIDHPTGLGPDEMIMKKRDGGDPQAGRWYEQVEKWEREGRVGLSPGLQEVPPAPPELRDYSAQNVAYLLRPEVSDLLRNPANRHSNHGEL